MTIPTPSNLIEPALADDALLADITATRDDRSNTLRLWWLGQSGFLFQCHGRHVLFDPYLSDSLTLKYANTEKPHTRMSRRVIAPEKLDFLDIITTTHNHTDHLDADTLNPIAQATLARNANLPTLISPAANQDFILERLGEKWKPSVTLGALTAGQKKTFTDLTIHAVPAAHDQLTTDPQGRHIYLGFILQYRGHTIYHSGDTVVYKGMADLLRPFNIDIAFLPINGKVGNMNGAAAATLAKQIKAKLVIPCHYDMFTFNTANPADQFIPTCQSLKQPHQILRLGERFTYL